jgi:type II secretory pathway pseudopilin PulG
MMSRPISSTIEYAFLRQAKPGVTIYEIMVALVIVGILGVFIVPRVLTNQHDNARSLEQIGREVNSGFQLQRTTIGLFPADSSPSQLISPRLSDFSREVTPTTLQNPCTSLMDGPSTKYTLKPPNNELYIADQWQDGPNDFTDVCVLNTNDNKTHVFRVYRDGEMIADLNSVGSDGGVVMGDDPPPLEDTDFDQDDLDDGPQSLGLLYLDYIPTQKAQQWTHNNHSPANHMQHFSRQRRFAARQMAMIDQLLSDDYRNELTPQQVAGLQDLKNRWYTSNMPMYNTWKSTGQGYNWAYYMTLYMRDQIWIRNVYLYVNSNGAMPWLPGAGTTATWNTVALYMPPRPDRGLFDTNGEKVAYIESLHPN